MYIGMPLDNLSIDDNGDVFVAGFPKIWELVYASGRPRERDVGSSVWRIRRRGMKEEGEEGKMEWEVEKVLEDREGKFVSGATVAVHNVRTGRLFMGGIMAPFVTVCERVQEEGKMGKVGA